MKWMVLFFLFILTIAPAARCETVYYYCTSTSASHLRIYFSEIFSPLSDIDKSRFQKEFVYYLALHYGESIAGTAYCTVSTEMRLAETAKAKEIRDYQNMSWQVTLTRWKY